jgi:uncharacterized protein (TIRG00374 family)
MKKGILDTLKIIFFLSIGGLFIWLFTKDLSPEQVQEIYSSFSNASYWWIILSILVAVISHIIRTLRWQMLLKPLGHPARFWNVFMSLMIGYFANLALPRLGEVTRCGFLTKYEQVPFQKSFGTVIAERAFDVLTFVVLFFINLFIQYRVIHHYVDAKIIQPLSEKFTIIGKGYFLYGSIAFAAICLVLFFIFRKKLERFKLYRKIAGILKGFWDGLKSLTKLERPVLFLIYTVGIWFMYFLMTYLCFFSIKDMQGLSVMSGFSVLILGTIGIMVVQGGIGIYPAIVAETLVLYGAVATKAYALGWLIWTAQTFAIVMAGVIALIALPIYNKRQYGDNRINTEENPSA